jgi:peptidoglycan/LPS O-acetylase OafA/YrhL
MLRFVAASSRAVAMTGAQHPSKQRFFGSLEAMRGGAALIVALMHMPPVIGERSLPGLVHNGYLMVPFFFVLSGFVIHYNYFSALKDGRSLGRFMFLRFGRLYPVHVVFLFLWLVIEVARYVAATRGLHAPVTEPFRENSWTAFVENLFLVQALGFSHDAGTFNGPSWSISVEFYAYLVFAVLVLLTRRAFLAVAVAIAGLGLVLVASGSADSFGALVDCLTGFFIGCLVSIAAARTPPPAAASTVAVLLFLSVLMIWPLPAAMIVIYPLSAFLVFALVNERGFGARALSLAPLRWLGRISYSLYMSHALVFWCAGVVLAKLIGADLSAPAEDRYATLPPLGAAFAYAAMLALALAVAAATYHLIETPGRRWSRKRAGY